MHLSREEWTQEISQLKATSHNLEAELTEKLEAERSSLTSSIQAVEEASAEQLLSQMQVSFIVPS